MRVLNRRKGLKNVELFGAFSYIQNITYAAGPAIRRLLVITAFFTGYG